MSEEDNKLTKPHDKFIKAMFENKQAAQDFLRAVCPQQWVEHLDLTSIKQENPNFLNTDLSERFSDMLFSVEIYNRPGYIYCQIEHQQIAERFMALRFLNYATQIWLRDIKNQRNEVKELPVIIPVLLYTGVKKYPY